jgi:hypothetical protein
MKEISHGLVFGCVGLFVSLKTCDTLVRVTHNVLCIKIFFSVLISSLCAMSGCYYFVADL